MKLVAIISLMSGLWAMAAQAAYFKNELRPFVTDGCSMIPDGNILNCCIKHDLKYWQGGTAGDRLDADLGLKQCVYEVTGSETKAETIYMGVRSGGGPLRHTSYRWGYGWKYMRPYSPLTGEEKSEIAALMPVNILEYPVVHVDLTPEPLPVEFDNYCADDAADKVREIVGKNHKLTEISSQNVPHGDDASYEVEFSAEACKGIFKIEFVHTVAEMCQTSRYLPVTSSPHKMTITTTGSCKPFVKP
jgi:hypothetical protein